jgi:hypothetical protein
MNVVFDLRANNRRGVAEYLLGTKHAVETNQHVR